MFSQCFFIISVSSPQPPCLTQPCLLFISPSSQCNVRTKLSDWLLSVHSPGYLRSIERLLCVPNVMRWFLRHWILKPHKAFLSYKRSIFNILLILVDSRVNYPADVALTTQKWLSEIFDKSSAVSSKVSVCAWGTLDKLYKQSGVYWEKIFLSLVVSIVNYVCGTNVYTGSHAHVCMHREARNCLSPLFFEAGSLSGTWACLLG